MEKSGKPGRAPLSSSWRALVIARVVSTQTVPDTETRIALVIGNGAYANVPLKNPVNYPHDLADALKAWASPSRSLLTATRLQLPGQYAISATRSSGPMQSPSSTIPAKEFNTRAPIT